MFDGVVTEDILAAQEALCTTCGETGPMLCAGYRWNKDEFGRSPCHKLRVKMSVDRVETRVSKSSIPESFIEEWDETYPDWDDVRVRVLDPSNAARRDSWRWGLNLLYNQNQSVKYVPVQLVLKDADYWNRMLEVLGGPQYDLVIFDRFDLGSAPDMAIDLLCETVWARYNAERSMIVTANTDNPRIRATSEIALYRMFDEWK